MKTSIRRAAASLFLLALPALPAIADDACTRQVMPQALDALQIMLDKEKKIITEQVARIDGALQQCPDHAWINAIGSELDFSIYLTLKERNGGVPNQEAVNYLRRAFERSNKFQEGPGESRQSLYNIATSVNAYSKLDYITYANSRKRIIEGLMQIALMGTIHPYLAGTEAIKCGGWTVSDGQTVSYEIDTPAELVLMPFVDAVAEACRPGQENSDIVALALKARVYAIAVEREAVTDPEEIRRYLITAQQAADEYIAVAGSTSFYYDQFAVKRLDNLKRQHRVFIGPETIDRALWFTGDNIGSEVAVRSIVYSLDEYWTPLAAGDTDATGEEVAKARQQLMSYLLLLRKEGAEAGFRDEAISMVHDALVAYQTRTILSPERESRPDMPGWYYDMAVKVLKPQASGDVQ